MVGTTITLNFLSDLGIGHAQGGVRDFSLSRSKVEWGIPVPWDKAQTIYVWTEALHGYLTGVIQAVTMRFPQYLRVQSSKVGASHLTHSLRPEPRQSSQPAVRM